MAVGQSLTNSDVVALQLERVTPLVSRYYESETTLLSRFKGKMDSFDQSSRDMRMPIPINPGGKFRQADFNGGDLGRGSAPVYAYAVLAPLGFTEAIEYNAQVEMVTDSRVKSITGVINRLVVDAMEEFKTNQDRLLQTAGNGVVMVLSGVPSANVFTGTTTTFGSQLLRYNNTYSVYDSTLATNRGTVVVQSVNTASGTATMDTTPAGTTTGDKLVIDGLSGASPVSLFGLPYNANSAATGTWLGLSRVTYPQLRTPEVVASSQITTTLPQILEVLMEQALGQDIWETGAWTYYLNPVQHQAWVALMNVISEISLPMGGGNKEVDLLFGRKKQRQIGGIPVMTSINADKSRMDLIDLENWFRGTYLDTTILNMAGLQKIPVYGASGGWGSRSLFYIANAIQTGVFNPRRGGYISSITLPPGY